MKQLFFLLILAVLGGGAYVYFIDPTVVDKAPPVVSAFLKNPLNVQKVDPATGRPIVPCTHCKASGTTKCTGPKCKDGQVDCPAPCLKLSVGRWEKLEGHNPNEVYRIFRYDGGWKGWSSAHVGELVEIRGGIPESMGMCKVCNGTTKIHCAKCSGTAQLTCILCQGRKEIVSRHALGTPKPSQGNIKSAAPQKSTAAPNPVQTFRLKNGKTVTGKITITDSSMTWIRTEDGKTQQVRTSDILSD